MSKLTGSVSNSTEVVEELSRRCEGKNGYWFRRARFAGLCSRGGVAQLRGGDLFKAGCYGIQGLDDDAEVLRNLVGPAPGYPANCNDDLCRQVLKDPLIEEALADELL